MDFTAPQVMAAGITGICVLIAARIQYSKAATRRWARTISQTSKDEWEEPPPPFPILRLVLALGAVLVFVVQYIPSDPGAGVPPQVDKTSANPTASESPSADRGGSTVDAEGAKIQDFFDDYADDIREHRFDQDETVLNRYIEFPMSRWYSEEGAGRTRVAGAVWPSDATKKAYEPSTYRRVCDRDADLVAVETEVDYFDKKIEDFASVRVVYKLRVSEHGQPYRITSVQENAACTL